MAIKIKDIQRQLKNKERISGEDAYRLARSIEEQDKDHSEEIKQLQGVTVRPIKRRNRRI